MRALRILLIEDNEVISAILAELLTEMGHEVCGQARTEQQAVRDAARLSPELMIVDVQLQTGSGVSAMETVLRDTAMPHFFITGTTPQGIPKTATILRKPFTTAGLQAALERVMPNGADKQV